MDIFSGSISDTYSLSTQDEDEYECYDDDSELEYSENELGDVFVRSEPSNARHSYHEYLAGAPATTLYQGEGQTDSDDDDDDVQSERDSKVNGYGDSSEDSDSGSGEDDELEWTCDIWQDGLNDMDTLYQGFGDGLWTLHVQPSHSDNRHSQLPPDYSTSAIQFSLDTSTLSYTDNVGVAFPLSAVFPSLLPEPEACASMSYPRYSKPQEVRILYRELNPNLRKGNGTISQLWASICPPLVSFQHWAVEVGERGSTYILELQYRKHGSQLVVTSPGNSAARQRYKSARQLISGGTTIMQMEEIHKVAQQIIDSRPKYVLGVSDCQNFAIDLAYRIVVHPSTVLAARKQFTRGIRPLIKFVSAKLTRVFENLGVIEEPPKIEPWRRV